VRPKASGAGLICRTDQCFQRQRLPYQDKNREISPLEREREEGYGGKDLEKRSNWLRASRVTTAFFNVLINYCCTCTSRPFQLWDLALTSRAGGRHNMPPPLWPWPLTFWPWKWCPSHVWRGLPLCQF